MRLSPPRRLWYDGEKAGGGARLLDWFVYILLCADGTLYTGSSTDVDRRCAAHNAGRGAKYTRSRCPVTVVFRERCGDKSAALRREAAIKKLTRAQKLALIESAAPKKQAAD